MSSEIEKVLRFVVWCGRSAERIEAKHSSNGWGLPRRYVIVRKTSVIMTVAVLVFSVYVAAACAQNRQFRRLPVAEYIDKMKAGWIGQMAGVGWGGPTEFRWRGAIIPEDEMPEWTPMKINQFYQDDIYVEMTFVRTLELYGLDASIRQAGIDFASSGYMLWHANKAGRDNLRNGIAPPDSGHPNFNSHADDIDYQIEADYAGLISPGMPNAGIQLGEVFGRLMNYGDGLYGGQFVAGMYAEAFFETDMKKVVRAGLRCVPEGSQFHECINDVLRWHDENPNDWKKTWQLIEDKYNDNPDYRRFSCGRDREFNIDAKINGAYIAIGMLYGKGDLDDTIIVSTRCGQDSDCNPSNAAGILFTSIGYSNLPERFTSALDRDGRFSHTPYSFPRLVAVCEKLVRQAVLKEGGRIEKDEQFADVLVIPVRDPKPTPLEQCWEPGPIANSRFTEGEMRMIVVPESEEEEASVADIDEAITQFASGWTVENCGDDMSPGLHDELRGKENVLVTHPLSQETPCTISKNVDIPEDKTTTLRLVVGHHEEGDWVLVVLAGEVVLLQTRVGEGATEDGWMDVEVDLSNYAGSVAELQLLNKANDWAWEAGYWAEIAIASE